MQFLLARILLMGTPLRSAAKTLNYRCELGTAARNWFAKNNKP
jgi:hypothetical protein